jgi:hypothetical protein
MPCEKEGYQEVLGWYLCQRQGRNQGGVESSIPGIVTSENCLGECCQEGQFQCCCVLISICCNFEFAKTKFCSGLIRMCYGTTYCYCQCGYNLYLPLKIFDCWYLWLNQDRNVLCALSLNDLVMLRLLLPRVEIRTGRAAGFRAVWLLTTVYPAKTCNLICVWFCHTFELLHFIIHMVHLSWSLIFANFCHTGF